MNVPDFKRYGVLGYFKFCSKSDEFAYIKMKEHDDRINNTLRQSIRTALFGHTNKLMTKLVTDTQDKKLLELKWHIARVELHKVTRQADISTSYTTINEATTLVIEETSRLLLPTIPTNHLYQELWLRITSYFRK